MIEIVKPTPEQVDLLTAAQQLIAGYASQGLMLELTLDRLTSMSQARKLVLAVENGQVVGTAGITFSYPDRVEEFGAWSVESTLRYSGIGGQLLNQALKCSEGGRVVAFANKNSGPIFERMGVTRLPHENMHSDAFRPCQTCNCNKAGFKPGQQCADVIYDLSVLLALTEEFEIN